MSTPSGAPKLARGTETILVVEDEPAVRTFVSEVLRTCGYTILEAAHGHEAIFAVKKHEGEVHLLLSDLMMKWMNGRRTAEEIALLRPGIKVLFMSGYTDDPIVKQSVQEGRSFFLPKPFTPGNLAAKVREVLDHVTTS